ncbi:hypothetical protein M427DRAFT_155022, partial [Gonapodya prolifera JEL478]
MVRELKSPASMYSLLYLCREFSERATTDVGARDLWKTRALVAQTLAVRLLKWVRGPEALVQCLFGEFSPEDVVVELGESIVDDGYSSQSHSLPTVMGVVRSRRSTSSFSNMPALSSAASLPHLCGSRLSLYPEEDFVAKISVLSVKDADAVPESALSLAVDCHALRFTAHPLVQEIVGLLWEGKVVVVSGGRDKPGNNIGLNEVAASGTTGPGGVWVRWVEAPTTAQEIFNARRFFDIDKLRIPKYQYLSSLATTMLFLALFTSLSFTRPPLVTPLEVVCDALALSLLMEELAALKAGGITFYLENLWNWLDVGIFSTYIAFFVMRFTSLSTGDEALTQRAFDVLAIVNIFLWPRFLAILD